MKIGFLRVVGARYPDARVIASADDWYVRWYPDTGWSCDCDTAGPHCEHVDAIAGLLDPRVAGQNPWRRNPRRPRTPRGAPESPRLTADRSTSCTTRPTDHGGRTNPKKE